MYNSSTIIRKPSEIKLESMKSKIVSDYDIDISISVSRAILGIRLSVIHQYIYIHRNSVLWNVQ